MNHRRFLLPHQISWDLKGPCADCPFRRNAPDHEGVAANLVNIITAIEDNRFSHTCHKTDNEADGPKNHAGPIQHCGGALHFIVRAKCDLQLPLLRAAEAGRIDLEALMARAKKDERVFKSTRELLAYYLAMAERLLAKSPAEGSRA